MKDCLILGFPTAMAYNDVYPLLVNKEFYAINHHVCWKKDGKKIIDCIWYCTLPLKREKLPLAKRYSPTEYLSYSNYDAIESKSKDIPVDYQDKIGVPISFFFYYPELDYEVLEHRGDLKLNNKAVYERLIIRKKTTNPKRLKTNNTPQGINKK